MSCEEFCGIGCALFLEAPPLFFTCLIGCEAACVGTIQAKVLRTKAAAV